jgi:hypothetical protein
MLTLILGFGLILAFVVGTAGYLIAQENLEIERLRTERAEILAGRRI